MRHHSNAAVSTRMRVGAPIVGAALQAALVGSAWAPTARAQAKPPDPPGVHAPANDPGLADIDRARALAKQANRALQKAQSYAEALDYATRAEAL